jgi:hypothetical protein
MSGTTRADKVRDALIAMLERISRDETRSSRDRLRTRKAGRESQSMPPGTVVVQIASLDRHATSPCYEIAALWTYLIVYTADAEGRGDVRALLDRERIIVATDALAAATDGVTFARVEPMTQRTEIDGYLYHSGTITTRYRLPASVVTATAQDVANG